MISTKFRKILITSLALLLAITFIIALFSDEQPSLLYQKMMAVPEVSSEDWQNTQQLVKYGLKPGHSTKDIEEFMELLKRGNIDEARQLSDAAFWSWSNSGNRDPICEEVESESDEQRTCIKQFIGNPKVVQEYYLNNLEYTNTYLKSIDITTAQFDENQFTSAENIFEIEEIFGYASMSPFVNRDINTYGMLGPILSPRTDIDACKRYMVEVYNKRAQLQASVNQIIISVAMLVEQSQRLEILNSLLTEYPVLAACIIQLDKPNKNIFRAFADNLARQNRSFSKGFPRRFKYETVGNSLRSLKNFMFFKPQKFQNQNSEICDQMIRNLLYQFTHPYAKSVRDIDPEQFKFRNWNNIVGQILINIATPKFQDLSLEYSKLLFKQQLVRAHAALIECRQARKNDCDTVISNYRDPFYGNPASLLDEGTAIGFVFSSELSTKEYKIPLRIN